MGKAAPAMYARSDRRKNYPSKGKQFLRDYSQSRTAYLVGIWRSEISIAAQRYFLVGGISAIMEWTFFAIVLYWLDQHYLISGACSFICNCSELLLVG